MWSKLRLNRRNGDNVLMSTQTLMSAWRHSPRRMKREAITGHVNEAAERLHSHDRF